MLLSQRRWLAGFATEAAGWLLYVAALSLAPLSLVQATAAGGIGILAVMVSHYTRVPLSRVERLGVLVSVAGLALLGVSLAGAHGEGSGGSYLAVGAWLGAAVAVTLLALRFAPRLIGGGPAFGLATGILFAAGDVATKTAMVGGAHAYFAIALIACYGLGTAVLQAGFQRGNALVTAGIATLFTNALPIIAGMTPSSTSHSQTAGSGRYASPHSSSSSSARYRSPATKRAPPPPPHNNNSRALRPRQLS